MAVARLLLEKQQQARMQKGFGQTTRSPAVQCAPPGRRSRAPALLLKGACWERPRSQVVLARYARNQRLADACQQWAFCAITASPGASAHNDQRACAGAVRVKTRTDGARLGNDTLSWPQ